jgi:Tat protein secretion system quality control protein TatD with DNase activity
MGFVDRGGGRESKGSSLRRSKKNPGAAAARVKREENPTASSAPSQPPVPPTLSQGNHRIDASVAILSRKFDADRERLLDRASEESRCGAFLCWCSEFEKQETLSKRCAEKPGQLYCYLGVHPDNVDRTNKKAHQSWIDVTEQLVKPQQCVGVLTGIDMSRELSTHFAQEFLFHSLVDVAAKNSLPVVLHVHPDPDSASRFVELYKGSIAERFPDQVFLLRDAIALALCSEPFADLLRSHSHTLLAMISARGFFDADTFERAKDMLIQLSAEQLIVVTDSPWHTPQNIPDEHLRTLHNEPANLSFVWQWIGGLWGRGDIDEIVSDNLLRCFFRPIQLNSELPPHSADEGDLSRTSEDDPNPVPEDRAETSDTTGHLLPIPNGRVSVAYLCIKCRSRCFDETFRVTHGPDAARQSALSKTRLAPCEEAIFIRHDSTLPTLGVRVSGEGVVCGSCGGKLGTVIKNPVCPCGSTLEGSTMRIIPSRVEIVDEALSVDDLLRQARDELEERSSTDDLEDKPSERGRKKEPKKNVKANNKSNFTNFRNKSFAQTPVAPVVSKEQKEGRRSKKGKRGKLSSDEED